MRAMTNGSPPSTGSCTRDQHLAGTSLTRPFRQLSTGAYRACSHSYAFNTVYDSHGLRLSSCHPVARPGQVRLESAYVMWAADCRPTFSAAMAVPVQMVMGRTTSTYRACSPSLTHQLHSYTLTHTDTHTHARTHTRARTHTHTSLHRSWQLYPNCAYLKTTHSSYSTALGLIPPASAFSTMPIFSLSGHPPPALTASGLATITTSEVSTSIAGPLPHTSTSGPGQAMLLSSALPPIAAKVVTKIKSGQYVPMKDLLADNMSLYNLLEALPGTQHVYTSLPKPRLCEIQSPLTWVSCFLAYVAVLTPDAKTRDLLTYGCLIVREAQRHNGPGWCEYDKIFRQHAAIDETVKWNEINPSLHASTVLTYRSGPSQCCGLCHEPDHSATECAMLALQPHYISPALAPCWVAAAALRDRVVL